MLTALFSDFTPESKLLPVVKHVCLSKIQEFCVMSQAAGPIHVDTAYCAKTPFKKPLVPGFMISGYVAEMMENNFGEDWFNSGEMEISFVKPAQPGDTLLVEGTVREYADGKLSVEINVTNHKGGKVAKGACALTVTDRG